MTQGIINTEVYEGWWKKWGYFLFVLVAFLKVMNEPSMPSDTSAPACFPQQYKSSLPELSVSLLGMIAGGEGMYQWGKYFSSNILPVPPKASPFLWTRPEWHLGLCTYVMVYKVCNGIETARKPCCGCLCDTSHPGNALLGSMGSLMWRLRYGKRKEKKNVNKRCWERSLRRDCASVENITTFILLIIFFSRRKRVILKLSGVWALLEHSALMKGRVRSILGLKELRMLACTQSWNKNCCGA